MTTQPFYGNQFLPAAGGFPAGRGGLIHVTMEIEALRRTFQNMLGQFDRSQGATFSALRDISMELMEAQRDALQSRLDTTGRVQARGDALLEALVNEQNRKLTADGFTVGYLDQAWSKVSLYYRGLESGTDVHTTAVSGLSLRGYWVTPGGLQGPVGGGKNAVGFSGRYVEHGGFAIKRPIPAYHYMELGTLRWLKESNGGQSFLALMAKNYDAAGLDWMARFTGAAGHAPSVTDISVSIEGIAG